MATTLYRKYRPKTFAELIGQNHIKTTLMSELESDKLAHAYLFSGPRGLGKTTTARLLAKAVNCLNRKDGQAEPCNKCNSCEEVMQAKSLDVIEVDAASHTGVDNVRENIIENARFTPTSRKFKVFIIDEVHMLSTSAFNALLKTLEEPPAHAIFILATTEIHKVPETIISRCQHFDFRKINNQEIVKRLDYIVSQEKKKISKNVLESIAYYGQGCLRDAESLLGQVLSLGEKEITDEQAELVLPQSRFDLALELLELINKNDSAQSLSLINNLVEDGIDLEKFTADLIELARKILLIKISPQLVEFGGAINKDLEIKISDLANQTQLDFIIKVIEVMLVRKQELKYAEISQLPLELGVLEIIKQEDDSSSAGGNLNSGREVKIQKDEPSGNKSKKEIKQMAVKVEITDQKPEAVKQEVVKAENKILKQVQDDKPSGIKFHQIKSKWSHIVEAIKNHNHSLSSTLKISKPDKILDSGTLLIHCPNKFLQDRLMEDKNLKILENVLEEIFGVKLTIKIEVNDKLAVMSNRDMDESSATDDKPENKSVDNLLKAFGGQAVE